MHGNRDNKFKVGYREENGKTYIYDVIIRFISNISKRLV